MDKKQVIEKKSTTHEKSEKPEDITDNKEPKKKSGLKAKEVVQEDFTSFAKKLKKTEVIKRPIEKVELETVDLVHHEFEASPQNPAEEMISSMKIVSNELVEIPDVVEEEPKKKKKKKILKVQKKEETSKEPEPEPVKKLSVQEPTEEWKTVKDLKPVPQDVEEKPKEKPAVDEPTQMVELKHFEPEPEDVKIEETEVAEFQDIELKPAELVKRPIEELTLEHVDLFHHDFENSPEQNPEEGKTSVSLISQGDFIDYQKQIEEAEEKGNKTKKVKKIIKKTKPLKKELSQRSGVSPKRFTHESPQNNWPCSFWAASNCNLNRGFYFLWVGTCEKAILMSSRV